MVCRLAAGGRRIRTLGPALKRNHRSDPRPMGFRARLYRLGAVPIPGRTENSDSSAATPKGVPYRGIGSVPGYGASIAARGVT